MIKIIFLISLFLFQNGYAEDCGDRSEVEDMADSLSIPNCYNSETLSITKSYPEDPEAICNDCKTKFERNSGKKINPPQKEILQNDFFEAASQEYKKNIIDNLIFVTKLRTLPSSGTDFSNAAKACKMKSMDEIISGCSSESAKRYLKGSQRLKDLNSELQSELAKILSNSEYTPTKEPLLHRSQYACFIPEKDILLAANRTTEEIITPDMLNFFSSIDPSKYSSVAEILDSTELKSLYPGGMGDFKTAIEQHPQLSLLSSPSSFSNFFKTVKKPYKKSSLSEAIYDSNNGKKLDKDIAQRCEQTFESFKTSICSDKFEAGHIDTDPFLNSDKIASFRTPMAEDQFAGTEQLLNNNLKILSLCEIKPDRAKLNLTSINESISQSLSPTYRASNLENYRGEKFRIEIGAGAAYICENKNKECDITLFNCKMLKKYQEMENSQSLEHKLANSSNPEVNALLRSMIGDTSKIDPQTKEILVLNGIIPKDDGTLVAQADIPERQPDYFSRPQPQQAASATQVAQLSPAPAAAPTSRGQQQNVYSSEQYARNANFQPNANMPDLSDIMRESDQNLREVQDEIMRRLSTLPNNRPASQEQARTIARDSFRSRGASLSQTQENALVNRLMAQPAPSSTTGNDPFFDNNQRNEVASSDTETATEKYRKDGMNRALADMAGARAAMASAGTNGRGPASTNEDNARPLTNVALNISNDPQVSLSQQFADKFNRNDPETQLLKVLVDSKKNFLLTVRNVNFKVVFDEQNNMNLLLDSGDREEAQRLRPQLEIFFRRLRSI